MLLLSLFFNGRLWNLQTGDAYISRRDIFDLHKRKMIELQYRSTVRGIRYSYVAKTMQFLIRTPNGTKFEQNLNKTQYAAVQTYVLSIVCLDGYYIRLVLTLNVKHCGSQCK